MYQSQSACSLFFFTSVDNDVCGKCGMERVAHRTSACSVFFFMSVDSEVCGKCGLLPTAHGDHNGDFIGMKNNLS
jgi:hypothetical protein